MKRREMLAKVVAGAGLVVAGAVAGPPLVTVLSPVLRRRRRDVWRPIGGVDGFVDGSTTRALVELPHEDWARGLGVQAVYVRRIADEFIVFSRKCTDLGCPVVWDPGSTWFFCPCHGGIFDHEGRPQAGPPPRPLYRYDYRVRNGTLEIDLSSVPEAA